MADENMVNFSVEPQENGKENKEDEMEVENEDDIENEEEFQALNQKLDQLHSVLDSLEQKNDNIHAELVDLLKENREARKYYQESSQK